MDKHQETVQDKQELCNDAHYLLILQDKTFQIALITEKVVRICRSKLPAPLRLSGQGPFSVQQEIIRKGGSNGNEV